MQSLILPDDAGPLIFEGVEKKLEVKLRPPPHLSNQPFFRDISPAEWGYLLQSFGCRILNVEKNDHFDAYLLSESSLFVYSDRVILKTCGTTRLLSCIPTLLQYANNVFDGEFEVDYVLFTRRNYKYPDKQCYPHTSWDEEISVLKHSFPTGKDYLVGDKNGDHFHLFIDDQRTKDAEVPSYSTIEIAMNDLCRQAMSHYYKKPKLSKDAPEANILKDSGLNNILPTEAVVDSMMFDPFGFSLNGLDEKIYYTMHITPQPECSYVSYETNVSAFDEDFGKMSERVTDFFSPGRYSIAVIHSKNVKAPSIIKDRDFVTIDISNHLVLNFYSNFKGK